MDRKATLRWGVLLGTAATTAVFSFYPTEDNSIVNPMHATRRPENNLHAVQSVNADASKSDETDFLDPFAPRGWQSSSASPVATAALAAAPVMPIVPSVPAGAPPLPFKFMGAMNEDSLLTIYLSKGEQTIVAHVDDVLDGSYKVLAFDNQHIDFEYIPTGEKQTLAFPSSEN